jgi:hypothetical protein
MSVCAVGCSILAVVTVLLEICVILATHGLRQPVILGIREDKNANEVIRERAS